MKKAKKFTCLLILFCSLFLCLMVFCQPSMAADSLTPAAQDNLNVSLRRTSDLVPISDGYMRVFYKKTAVGIEYYDNNLQIRSRKEVALELPLWGGFYAGSDGYYLVEGQKNTAEDDSAEVIRVIRYDKNWNRNGAASITSNPDLFGGEVRYPFDYGCVEMSESNGKLYVVTGHEGYVDASVGQGHQGFLMIEVEQSSMTGKIVSCDLWHSFAQYIKSKDNYMYVLEQSEGSRCTKLSRYDRDTLDRTTIELFPYGGSRTSVWALNCYASVDGMAVSSDQVLCIGTSIDQSKYDQVTEDTPHNIYLTVTPMSDFSQNATVIRQLTNFTDNGKSFMGVKITKISDNRFMISWEEYIDQEHQKYADDDNLSSSTLHYLFVDGKGNTISKEFTTVAPISDCQPVVKDSKVVYYASNKNTVNFYTIDSSNGTAAKKSYRVAGENASWDFKNGVLTISGQGAISISDEENYRQPVSSTQYGYTFTNGTAWKSIQNRIKKIVIKTGITSVSDNAFTYLPSLEEVEIEKGVQKIGKEAFAYCENLALVTLPSSVTCLGDGFAAYYDYNYWTGEEEYLTYATIHAPYNSYAITYAKKNNLRYACDITEATVTGLQKSYDYTGSPITPALTVTLGNQKLDGTTHYSVSYDNNIKAGTATMNITGKNGYYGTITLTFQIVSVNNSNSNNNGSGSGNSNGTGTGNNNNTNGDNNQQAAVKTFSDAYNVYTVNKSGSTVTLKKPRSRKVTTAKIPSTVKANGKTYKVTAIASGAFKNCSKLKQVTISGNITTIGTGAFQGCKVLRTVKIGSKVTSIGSKAFYDCKALTSVTIQTKKLSSGKVGKSAFTKAGRNNYKKLKVRVPKSKLSAYKKLLKSKGLSSKAKVSK
nr:leucine-rich repeat domain-containing protein [uncultured Blautia sp.]